ncbi:MAG: hypothetical protein ACR2OZ_14240 [Verrucomicrobiales bacterium]
MGTDVVDWALYMTGIDDFDPRRVAWIQGQPQRALTHVTWTNPHPDKTIRALDFISAKTSAAPFLVAVTAE